MRIGVAQINTTPGDFAQMASRIVSLSETAASQGVDLLCFPSTVTTGSLVPFEACATEFVLDAVGALAEAAKSVACPCLVPIPTLELLGRIDCCALLSEGQMSVHDAAGQLMWPGDVVESSRDAGGRPGPVVEARSKRVMFVTQHEGLFDFSLGPRDVDVVVFAPALGTAFDEPDSFLGVDLSHTAYPYLASALESWLVVVSPVGGYGTQVFPGGSCVLSPSGSVVDCARSLDEVLLVTDLLEPESPEAPRELAKGDRHAFLWQLLVAGTRDFLHKQGWRHVVLALDGTLSSMVAAAIATDALGPTNVHAIVDAPESVEREAACQRLARNLRIDCRDGSDLAALPPAKEASDLLLRRGIVEAYLASWAAELDGMVLSCADKTSLALGGALHPAAASLAPLGDVLLSDVVALAAQRNTASPVIPDISLRDAEKSRALGRGRFPALAAAPLREVEELVMERYEAGFEPSRSYEEVGFDQELVHEATVAMDEAECARLNVPLVLATSQWPLDRVLRPMRMAWHASTAGRGEPLQIDAVRSEYEPDPVADELRRALGLDDEDGSDADGGYGGRMPGRRLRDVAEDDMPADAREALAYLRDFAASGAFDASLPDPDGGLGSDAPADMGNNLTIKDAAGNRWPTPFSAN